MITRVELIDIVMPNDCNHYGSAFGGWVMGRIDIAAAVNPFLIQKTTTPTTN
jgi:acyl-CoA hydrolase